MYAKGIAPWEVWKTPDHAERSSAPPVLVPHHTPANGEPVA
jgi:hypothetical protein